MKSSDIFIAPQTKQPLMRRGKACLTAVGRKRFPIVFGVPILFDAADWHRELVEMILWEHSDEIEKIYADEETWRRDPNGLYCDTIRRLLQAAQNALFHTDRTFPAKENNGLTNPSGRIKPFVIEPL